IASPPRFANQVSISFRSRVIVEKYLLCFRNSPSPSITNTQAVTLFLCTSMPQQRLYTIRITGSFSEPGCEDARSNLESPPRARKNPATIRCAMQRPGQTPSRAQPHQSTAHLRSAPGSEQSLANRSLFHDPL